MISGKPHGNFWFSNLKNKTENSVEIGSEVKNLWKKLKFVKKSWKIVKNRQNWAFLTKNFAQRTLRGYQKVRGVYSRVFEGVRGCSRVFEGVRGYALVTLTYMKYNYSRKND